MTPGTSEEEGCTPALFLASREFFCGVVVHSVKEGFHLRRTGLLPHNNGDFFGGGALPHIDEYFGGGGTGPHNVGEFHRGAVTQMRRPGDAMICEVQVGTAWDVLRHVAADVWSSRAMLGSGCWRSGHHRRHHPSGRNGAVAHTHMGRSGGTMVCGMTCVIAHGCRLLPLGTLCDTAVGVLVVRGLTGLGRLRRCHPSGSVCARRLGSRW